jgi:hypothetical protein
VTGNQQFFFLPYLPTDGQRRKQMDWPTLAQSDTFHTADKWLPTFALETAAGLHFATIKPESEKNTRINHYNKYKN